MAEVLLGGNSPDRAARFVEEFRGRRSGVRTMADAAATYPGQVIVSLPSYVPTVEDLQRFSNARLREIGQENLGLTFPEDAFKHEMIAAISAVLHG